MPARTNDFQQLVAMLESLLENVTVEESKMFPDPDTGEPREVDVSYVLRGGFGGREVVVGVECVDRNRKRDVTWVEQMYGKHSRLGCDVVLLVSSSGFTRTAKKKTERFGYRTITPMITKSQLAKEMARRCRSPGRRSRAALTSGDGQPK